MTFSRFFRITPLVAIATLLVLPSPVDAQLDRLRRAADRARNVAERSLTDRANRVIDNVIYCAIGDDACVRRAQEEGKTPVFEDENGDLITDAEGNPITDPEAAAQAVEEPGSEVWRNYDFTPGSIVWYAMDLSDARVGRIPVDQIEFVEGNLQTVEKDGQKVLEASSSAIFRIPLPDNLPDRFTVELDWQADGPNFAVEFFTGGELDRNAWWVDLYRVGAIMAPGGQTASSLTGFDTSTQPLRFSIQVDRNAGRDDDYVIGYGGYERFGQVPNAQFPRGNVIEFRMDANPNYRTWISNIVVAVKPEAPLALELIETGSATTRGLLFDFNSARLKPESTPTLTEIVDALEDHPEMRVAIEGHTDDVGEDDYNLDLSQQRAQSVVEYLVDQGISPDRLQPVGKGELEPAADNSTEAGRRQNRRVVFKVLD